MKLKTIITLVAALVAVLLPWVLPIETLSVAGKINLSIFLLAAIFWILEPIPIYATSVLVILLQVFLLSREGPLVQMNPEFLAGFEAPSYTVYFGTLANPIIILFLGGFVLAAGAVKYQLDRNLSRIILKPFGTQPAYILMGLMLVTALLSGFMSNTATTAMMMAVILPIAAAAPEGDRFKIALALSIPFAANVGGILTPIGTPPNAIALGALNAQGVVIPFTSWMLLTAPVVIVLLTFLWFILVRVYPSSQKQLPLNLKGSFLISRNAIIMYLVFGLTIVLWVTETLHGIPSGLVAFIPVALLPTFNIIDRKDIRSLPWEVLWLMAGGIALGMAMSQTGMDRWLVDLVPWSALGSAGTLAAFGFVAILLATFIANTVAATLLIPIMMSLVASGVADGFAIQSAALTVALGASLGMSLPISTPPNAIAISTGMVDTNNMARIGIAMGVFGYLVLLLAAFLLWNFIF